MTGNEQEAFLKTRSDAIRELRANGVRPKPLDRLLSELGYDYAAPIRGRAEAVDRDALNQLARPRNDTPKNKAAVTPPTPPAAGGRRPRRRRRRRRSRSHSSATLSTRPSDRPSTSPRDVHRPGGLCDFELQADDRPGDRIRLALGSREVASRRPGRSRHDASRRKDRLAENRGRNYHESQIRRPSRPLAARTSGPREPCTSAQSRGLCATGLVPIAPDDTERVALRRAGGSDPGAGTLRAGGPPVGPAGGEPVRPRVPGPLERGGGIARGRRDGVGGEVPLPRARAIVSTGPARRRGDVEAPVDLDDRRGQPVSSRLEVARHRGGLGGAGGRTPRLWIESQRC